MKITKKNKKITPVLILAVISLILISTNFAENKNVEILSENIAKYNILSPPIAAGNHDPISINGNAELATFIDNEGLSGEGTEISPYIIEDFTINASTANGIDIKNTDVYLTIQNCIIKEGNSSIYFGIYLDATENIIITNNTLIDNFYGVYMRGSTNNILSENNISKNGGGTWNAGIFLKYSDNNTISDNYISDNINAGIYLSDSSNNSVIRNEISRNTWGILLWDAFNNTISMNNCDDNYSGILLYESNNNIVSLNNASNLQGEGIFLHESNYNSISENIASYNKQGIYVNWESGYNILFGNNASYNIEYGICMHYRSSNNTIYFNDIYNNQGDQAVEEMDSNDNQWDNGSVGNYWGDYTEKYPAAKNDSTYWNTPYEIDGDEECLGIDNFPLVNPISEYVEPEGKTISSFPFVNILFFISVGVYLLKKKVASKN